MEVEFSWPTVMYGMCCVLASGRLVTVRGHARSRGFGPVAAPCTAPCPWVHIRPVTCPGSLGQRPVVHHVLHDERGVQTLHAGQAGELTVVQLLERGEVGGGHAQQVVRVAEQALRL